jgi:hypothetical protein
MELVMEITVYNRYRPPGEPEQWKRTVLSGERYDDKPAVHWEGRQGVNVTNSGLDSDDDVLVMIWFCADAQGKKYINPTYYAKLPPHLVDRYWTIAPGLDRIAKGVITETPDAPMSAVFAMHDNIVTPTAVEICDYGSVLTRHMEISCK